MSVWLSNVQQAARRALVWSPVVAPPYVRHSAAFVFFCSVSDRVGLRAPHFTDPESRGTQTEEPPFELRTVFVVPPAFGQFLATGDSYQTIAFSFILSHSTVQGTSPQKEDWERMANEFWEIWNFPNCIGVLDGKHVIEAPANTGSLYFNYKKTFSIVLLALVDAQYKFTVVDIGVFGKNSDGGILSHSNFGKALEKNKLNIPNDRALPNTNIKLPYVIIGDEAFLLKTYLLRPYLGRQKYNDLEKKIFNERLSRARKVVEDAVSEVADTTSLSNFSSFPRQGSSAQMQAFQNRDQFKDFFNSPAGKLPWE
ncbi:protein ALP1-like [Rhopalosiphum maidis]|uniref:protein ALP1-like n=1 Tax=Rhopalosiphum maidis TaxID=43146 RepID=UPI000EFE8A07|nr:protein ALP1-like [Rhopalosiphum maidis]